jgi:hypothetical protein
MTSSDILRLKEASYSPSSKNAGMPAKRSAQEETPLPADEIVLQDPGHRHQPRVPEDFSFSTATSSGKDPASEDLIRESSSLPILIRAGAGAMLGLTLITSLAAALPARNSAVPVPVNGETSITRVIEDPRIENDVPEETGQPEPSGTAAGTFPPSLRLEAVDTAGIGDIRSAETRMGIQSYNNIELLNGLRLEVSRETYTVKKTDGSQSQVETHRKDFSSLGVDVGNGLFYDLNGNVTFNPMRLHEDFTTVTVTPQSFYDTITISRDGDRFNIIPRSSPVQGRTRIKAAEGRLTINYPGTIEPTTIIQEQSRTMVQSPGHMGLLDTVYITEKSDQVRIDSPGSKESTFIKYGENDEGDKEAKILLPESSHEINITRRGEITTIKYPESGNDTVITRSDNKTVIRPAGLGESITITREGNIIHVNHFGWKKDVSITVRN